ncbi:MAG: outer membrane protein transport protein [Candidatus Devosia phytovorans]|uniref:Outer membrane protein transport protein n=1 Tax=Candidatus Devosia phytovorans TaxID=3121372 RepID=A0AAJ6B0U2_9HYPH|nr:outer membrane protein transport protein [Devosia sp.]WEK05572.1 MAG: outer membrane protein transport protein [Devosia sp.]
MAHRHIRTIALAALAASSTIGAAHAGGLEANGYNWDLLFDPGTYVGKGTVTQVMISHDIQNPTVAPTLGTIATSSDRTYYNFAAKADLFDNASCLVSVQNPWGSGTDRTLAYAAATSQAARERLTSNDIGLTCAYGFNVGPGVLSAIGGISGQSLDYEASIPALLPGPTLGTVPLELDGNGVGWRVGAAYEIPDIALRVSAIYNAAVDYDLSGTLTTPLGASARSADVTTPQSFEVKAQSGIAPGWLALGSVKWVDWSVLQALTVTGGTPITTTFNYEDGWTVSAGLGHQLTDEVTVLGSLTWDKGTSRKNAAGDLDAGVQTDRWGVALGGAYKPNENFELSGGVSYSLIGSGANALGETWDSGNVLAFSLSAKATF